MSGTLSWLPSVDAVLGAGVGAAAVLLGTWLSSRSTRRRDRERVSAELLTIYLKEVHPRYGDAVKGFDEEATQAQVYNAHLVGNWFETFASLILGGYADSELVGAAGLKAEMKAFWDEATKAQPSGSTICPRRDWPNLRRFLK